MKIKLTVDLDPRDKEMEMALATELAEYIKEKYGFAIKQVTPHNISDKDWRK